MNESKQLTKLTKQEVARIKKLAIGDKKLSAAYILAARLAKGDVKWRNKANAVARDFVHNRRALGKALRGAGIGKGKKSTTVGDFGINWNISSRSQLLAELPDEDLIKELERMARTDIIQLAPLYRIVKTLKRHERMKKRRIKFSGKGWQLKVGDFASAVKEVAKPGTIHAIVTDPPYGKKFIPEYKKLAQVASEFLVDGGGVLVVMTGQANLDEVFTALTHKNLLYQWTLCYHTPGKSTQVFGRRVKSNWKPVIWLSKGKPTTEHLSDFVRNDKSDRRYHKWGQAVSGMASIIERFTVEGETVFDPFLGTGSTGIAAVRMGRKFLGIDIKRSCVQKTAERLEDDGSSSL